MNKIQSISSKFRLLFKAALFLVPIINLAVWIFYDKLPSEITVTLLPHTLNLNQININPITISLVCMVCMLQVSVILYALRQLLKLFKNYEIGEIFSLENVTFYRKLGYSFFAWVFCNKIADVLISLILTFQNPIGHRQITFRFDSIDLFGFVIGGLIIVIARIMNEGHKLNEEQSLTI